MKIVTVIGTRPQFIKAALISKQIQQYKSQGQSPGQGQGQGQQIEEIIVHTGQHYDQIMSDNFFQELEIPKPTYQLDTGNLPPGQMIGEMILKLTPILIAEKPTIVLVYGDCNTTLAGAIAANKLDIPIAHIEAGVRSYDREMPEEINRVLVDQIAEIKFCPTEIAQQRLLAEGIKDNVYVVGDPMMDLLEINRSRVLNQMPTILEKWGLLQMGYYVLTLHRVSNTQELWELEHLLDHLNNLDYPVVFPIHPRTAKLLNINSEPNFWSKIPFLRSRVKELNFYNIIFTPPLGYLEMMSLVAGCHGVLTDSGGLQKEAYAWKKPCVTLRTTTEWTELVQAGWNLLLCPYRSDVAEQIIDFKVKQSKQPKQPMQPHSSIFQPNSQKSIVEILIKHCSAERNQC